MSITPDLDPGPRLWDADPDVCCAAFQLGACAHTEALDDADIDALIAAWREEHPDEAAAADAEAARWAAQREAELAELDGAEEPF